MRKLVVVFLILSSSLASAQERDSTRWTTAQIVSLHSKVLNEDRKIQIYTPGLGSFDGKPMPPCPVLYVLDGDVLTGIVASEVEYLSASYYYLPPMIVVGISNYDHNRMRDLTPTAPREGFGGVTDSLAFGGGERFIRFMEEEVFPYVEGRYATAPFRILAGHSMGGLLAFHSLIRHPDLFNAVIAVSPSLWWDGQATLHEGLRKWFHEGMGDKPRFLFYSEASEGANMHAAIGILDTTLRLMPPPGLQFKYNVYPDETHGTEPIKAVEDALRWLYPGYYPGVGDSTATLVAAWFDRLSTRYGYAIKPPEWFVAKRGTRILASGKMEDAIDFFKLNTANYPSSGAGWQMLGDAYAKKGDSKSAAECYARARAGK